MHTIKYLVFLNRFINSIFVKYLPSEGLSFLTYSCRDGLEVLYGDIHLWLVFHNSTYIVNTAVTNFNAFLVNILHNLLFLA